MALRKMLGNLDDESVIELMKVIPTQSQYTLALWGLATVQDELAYLSHPRMNEIAFEVKEYLNSNKTLKEIKPLLKESRLIVKGLNDPVSLAAGYALITALGIVTTPTNSLGFTFYHVAYKTYQELGLKESREVYDAKAHLLFNDLAASLKKNCIRDEKNPVKINWNC